MLLVGLAITGLSGSVSAICDHQNSCLKCSGIDYGSFWKWWDEVGYNCKGAAPRCDAHGSSSCIYGIYYPSTGGSAGNCNTYCTTGNFVVDDGNCVAGCNIT